MDWSWLTPPIAAALAGGATALATLIAVTISGVLTARTSRRQTLAQFRIAIRQMQSQERVAAAARAEDRVKLLLTERRVLYGEVLDQARAMLRVATAWTSWMATPDLDLSAAWDKWRRANEAGEPKEAWDEDVLAYDRIATLASRANEVRRSLSAAMSGMELVAPPEVAGVARTLLSRIEETSTKDKAEAELRRLDRAFTEFVRACRRDLGADPDDPTKALQTVR